jgi:hypothetical protein
MTLLCIVCLNMPVATQAAITVACGHATCERHLPYVTTWAEAGLDTIVKIAKGNEVTA